MKAPLARSLPLALFQPPYYRLEPVRWDDPRFAQPNSEAKGESRSREKRYIHDAGHFTDHIVILRDVWR